MAVISFIDNDIILKLTSCDLFWEAMDLLCIESVDIRILNGARFVFKGNKVKQQYPAEVRNKAIELIKDFATVTADLSNPLFSLNIEGLDVGELTLIYEAIAEPNFYFLTGDKRCLRALVNTPELATAREKLKSRVVCLEQLIYKLIITEGFEVIRSKVTRARECNIALKVAFGSGDRSEEATVIWTLKERIKELNQECPNLLMNFSSV